MELDSATRKMLGMKTMRYQAPVDVRTARIKSEANVKVLASQLWKKSRLIVINPDEILDPVLKQAFINEAIRQFGNDHSAL